MVIRIIDIVPGADTGTQGNIVYLCLKKLLETNHVVIVSFEDIETATSSFVNAAFVQLLDVLSFLEFKDRIKVTKSGKQINDMIKTRMLQESSKIAA
ncbi:STAS-like domain-containing protein [Methylobacterium haplocladii]|uniref:DUF4325 domain-containing protein n=1 Tax=Methylobacterium haplocladii TaxID=1176176 RepID=A0A512IW59_9HYPH|nr:hypothetical protein MHA02_42900 [Methylobacterium haplocladii]GJD85757.1 hypothetical protein HPGCJGGD_3649 [Methylobacterium haplocladii]GLS59855.1 hypothetical protein GCM10007887_25280 [Methylobacterium haplocladii]